MKFKLVWLLAALSIMSTAVYANSSVGDRIPLKQGELSTKQKVIIVPPSTVMTVLTTYELNSDALLPGQTITVALPENFFYKDTLIAPKGSILTGNVVTVERASQDGTDGKLHLRFSLITTPYGLQIPIVAIIKTDDLSGVLVGTKDNNVKTEEKAISSQSLNNKNKKPKSKNSNNISLKTILNLGENVVIPIDTKFDIVLTQPITITPSKFN
ncbi:hypothetical protein IJ818_02250 [bacterium]|nr:hypothetical protein [bacterium]